VPTPTTSEIPIPKSWDEFEDIVADIYVREWADKHLQRNGRAGQRQNGVDIFGRPAYANGLRAGIQCKRLEERKLTSATIKAEVKKAESFEPPLFEFIVVTTDKRDALVQKAVRVLNDERTNDGKFAVHVVFWEDVCSKLASIGNYDLLIKHFAGFLALLAKALAATLISSEITSGASREERLRQMLARSRGRCIAGWQSLGVGRDLALELVDDVNVGAVTEDVLPNASHPFRLLVGELGIGKTLRVERVLQMAISVSLGNPSAQIPVYVDARNLTGPLYEHVIRAVSGLGDPQAQGCIVAIEEADRSKVDLADLIANSRELVSSLPNTSVLMTCRTLPVFPRVDERAPVPEMSEHATFALISRIVGRAIDPTVGWRWPYALRHAIRRPLFAILLAIYLSEHDGFPAALTDLLANVVLAALRRVSATEASIGTALQSLAAATIDRQGGSVPTAEVIGGASQEDLLRSGLVTQAPGSLAFPLPILAEWFASRYLLRHRDIVKGLVGDPARLLLWRYPLELAVADSDFEQSFELLAPVVSARPGFAAQILTDALGSWRSEATPALPPALECARRMRLAAEAWLESLRPLSEHLLPVGEGGVLLPLGVRINGEFVEYAWYQGKDDIAEVAPLPSDVEMHKVQNPPLWFPHHVLSSTGHPAWAWLWSLNLMRGELGGALSRSWLPILSGPLAHEKAWQIALEVMRFGNLRSRPISISDLEQRTATLREQAASTVIRARSGEQLWLPPLLAAIDTCRAEGREFLDAPWPGPDLQPREGENKIWDDYSDQRLLERATTIYAGALDGYQALLHAFFEKLIPDLPLASSLPVCFEASLEVGHHKNPPQAFGPELLWRWRLLPRGTQSTVNIRPEAEEDWTRSAERDHAALKHLEFTLDRPRAAAVLYAWSHRGEVRAFTPNSMTMLAYAWLWEDLKATSWVQGLLGRR
jgi:hypothetical protein